MRYNDIYFEDFTIGRTFESAGRTVSEDDIIAFGKSFVPLPYHIDPQAATDTMFGGVVAAGLHTASISFGLFLETGVFEECGMGSPGIEDMRWRRPVRPGDTLRVVVEVAEAIPAKGARRRNMIHLDFRTLNQDDEVVMTMRTLHYVKSRTG